MENPNHDARTTMHAASRKAQLGFGLGLGNSFSDLAIPLAIIVILALVAVPAWFDYRTRARVSEGINAAAPAKAAVEKAFAAKGPADMSQRAATGWIPPAATEHLRTVAIRRDGTVTLQFGESVAPAGENEIQIVPVSGGKALDLSRAESAGRKFEWQCGGGAGRTTLPEKFRPEGCR